MEQEDEVYRFLKERDGWCTVQAIVNHLNVRQANVNRRVNQLYKYGLVIIIVSGKKHLIKIREEMEEKNEKK